jgi:16S rRNA (cytosine967-C5)-methyltransferase
MRTDSPRDLALKALNSLISKPRHSGNYLENLFRINPHLDDRDRAFISQIVQGVLRWLKRIDRIISQFSHISLNKIDSHPLNILRIAVYQIFYLDRVPESAAVNEAVNQTKKRKHSRHIISFVNGLLREICRNKDKITFPDREGERSAFLSTFYSYPEWLVNKWIGEVGKDFTEKLLAAQNNLPYLNIRTNTLKVTRERLIDYLADEGIAGKALSYAPEAILLEGFKGRVTESEAFKRGLFQVQDQGAQVVSHLLNPRPGDIVLDICAGLGGKTTHLLEIMGGEGRVIALDINRTRLVNLLNNARRLGIAGVMPVTADASISLESVFRNKFKTVLVDAPCSGLGVISRHPDGKWNRNEGDIGRLAQLQKSIINTAALLVQKGGNILYVTCTVSREENEEVVQDFLSNNRDISLIDLKETSPEWAVDLIDDQGFFRSYPHIHNMDGFFAALFMKNN